MKIKEKYTKRIIHENKEKIHEKRIIHEEIDYTWKDDYTWKNGLYMKNANPLLHGVSGYLFSLNIAIKFNRLFVTKKINHLSCSTITSN